MNLARICPRPVKWLLLVPRWIDNWPSPKESFWKDKTRSNLSLGGREQGRQTPPHFMQLSTAMIVSKPNTVRQIDLLESLALERRLSARDRITKARSVECLLEPGDDIGNVNKRDLVTGRSEMCWRRRIG